MPSFTTLFSLASRTLASAWPNEWRVRRVPVWAEVACAVAQHTRAAMTTPDCTRPLRLTVASFLAESSSAERSSTPRSGRWPLTVPSRVEAIDALQILRAKSPAVSLHCRRSGGIHTPAHLHTH